MSCTNPMIGVPKEGKVGMLLYDRYTFAQKYLSKRIVIELMPYKDKYGDNALEIYYQKVSPFLYDMTFETVDKLTGKTIKMYPQYIPCGKCLGCRLDYSRDWSNRCIMESIRHEVNWFITLTYDDANLTRGKVYLHTDEQLKDFEIPHWQEVEAYTLVPDDVTKFIKRLREYYSRVKNIDNIRYFYCGEYGGQTARPHYHILVFGLDIDDLRLYKTTMKGDALYNSDTIQKLWSNGFAVIAEMNWKTCAYTARYILKKQGEGKKHKGFYDDIGLYQEFTRMSRMPGIATSYYEAHVNKILEEDKIVLPAIDGKPHIITPGRSFTNFVENSGRYDWMEKLSLNKQNRREKASDMLKEVHYHLNMSDEEYFAQNYEISKKTAETLTFFRNKA